MTSALTITFQGVYSCFENKQFKCVLLASILQAMNQSIAQSNLPPKTGTQIQESDWLSLWLVAMVINAESISFQGTKYVYIGI